MNIPHTFGDGRRTYYDHEPAYRAILQNNGSGWDDRSGSNSQDSYRGFHDFLQSGYLPSLDVVRHALDLGCGGGEVALRLSRYGCVAIGVDYSETAVAIARRNAVDAGVSATFLVGDCLSLEGVPSGSMDIVVDNHLLHCLIWERHRLQLLQSVRRVLKPEGILFSETMSCEGAFSPVAVEANPASRVSYNWTRIWVSLAQLNRELSISGFRVLFQRARQPCDPPESGMLIETYASSMQE